MISLLIALSVGSAFEDPTPPTLVYYNARMALRDRQPTEALKLWLVRNVLESETDALSEYDEDFLSLTWVAAGDLGLCQDGLSFDTDGAGLWPLALHNWFLQNMRRGEPPDQPNPFDSFQIPHQQRFVSLNDVLSVEELRTVRFYRTNCYRMKDLLVAAGLSASAESAERDAQVRVLTFLLRAARTTTNPTNVRGRSTIDARLLDLRLKSMDLIERNARRAYREKRRQIKDLGGTALPPEDVAKSEAVREMLTVTQNWDADDWLALESGRRLYLYDWVRRAGLSSEDVILSVIDRLIDRRSGRELSSWVAYLETSEETRSKIWSGDRGLALLGLEKSTGFKERSAIALHRGVDAMGTGSLPDALRSFAYALHFAEESSEADDVRRLSLRWLSFVASRFEVTDELVTMLVQLVPRGDLAKILEGLIWDAALSADQISFARTINAHRGRGALRQRVERLEPLARGDAGTFLTKIREELEESPHATLRFIRRYLERLETQDGDVRTNHRSTLRALRELLIATAEELGGGLARTATELEGHTVAMLEGLPELEATDSARDRARALAPGSEVFAGSIRLAPSDPLPWPFLLSDVRPPSVFKRLRITPIEWRAEGELVMGWKLGR